LKKNGEGGKGGKRGFVCGEKRKTPPGASRGQYPRGKKPPLKKNSVVPQEEPIWIIRKYVCRE